MMYKRGMTEEEVKAMGAEFVETYIGADGNEYKTYEEDLDEGYFLSMELLDGKVIDIQKYFCG